VRLSDSRAEARFRAELSEWLDENQPAADRASDPPRSPGHIPGWARDWQRTLFDAGWLVPRWPAELGGREATAIEQMIYLEELARRQVPRTTNPQGLDVCAPTLADHGDGEPHDDWLRATLHGELAWCVAVDDAATEGAAADGETERGTAGPVVSEAKGGRLTLHGSVPAPAGAADADLCLCGAVVEDGGRRVDGAALLVVELDGSGVVRPRDADATLVFDAVELDAGHVIGQRDDGWSAVQSVRARRRSVRWITSLVSTERALESLAEVGRSRGLAEDGVFRDTLAGLRVEADAVRALAYRALAKQETGRPNPELAMLPLATAQVEERVYATGVEVLGADALDMGLDGPQGWPGGSWASEWSTAASGAAAAGGLGAERDRVAGRVLGMRLR
jgi:alkylation response protein AidB-like acyl-CoA dehydrogenase